MKKIVVGLVCVFFLTYGSASAETTKENLSHDKPTDHLLLSLFSNEIQSAVHDYYKNEDSILIMYIPTTKTVDSVSVFQDDTGSDPDGTFKIKFLVQPTAGGKILGKDTITFGINDAAENDDEKIKLINYAHSKQ